MSTERVSWRQIGSEPFRIFFAAAILTGICGVALWPLYFGGIVTFYPGQSHARLMAYGFFGGFILGFLGTSLPRMLSSPPLGLPAVGLLMAIYLSMSVLLFLGRTVAGDLLFLVLLVTFGGFMAVRAARRRDLPPPGFVLVLLALLCAAAGAVLSVAFSASETGFFWMALQHLLAYQGFMLLPMLGVGAFLLPRFFGAQSSHDFAESMVVPSAAWRRKALAAVIAGGLLLVSFWLEAAGWFRTGPALRFAVTLAYLAREVPLHRAAAKRSTITLWLRIAVALLLAGFLAIVFVPAYRISLLHLTLIGGFAVLTLLVATRVVFGHSGNLALLDGPNRWLTVSAGLMFLAMATRISGDFWPKVLASHYSYGAVLWIAGVLIWCAFVLPKVRQTESDD